MMAKKNEMSMAAWLGASYLQNVFGVLVCDAKFGYIVGCRK